MLACQYHLTSDNMLTDIVINYENVKYELKRLNCFKSFGPDIDGIHPKLLKSLAYDFKSVEAVVILFRACTDTVTIRMEVKIIELNIVGFQYLFIKFSESTQLNFDLSKLGQILKNARKNFRIWPPYSKLYSKT